MILSNKIVLLLIFGHLASAPRPQKEAAALVKIGAKVFIRGLWWNEELAKEDQQLACEIGVDYAPLIDLRKKNLASIVIRLKAKLARKLFLYTGLVTPRCIGLTAPEMLKETHVLKPDLIILHCEPALWVGKKLMLERFKIGVDFEDWFSNDLPHEARRERPVKALEQLERYHLKNADFCITTSNVMAEAMSQDAATERIPTFIPNCFPWQDRDSLAADQQDKRGDEVSLYWYSQTIGPGRGLETLGKALVDLAGDWRLRLRGTLRANDDWFNRTFPEELHSRIEILPPVVNAELLARNASHDIGLALESPFCRSRDLTITNKIFDYFRAGLAVVATNTLGQQEVAAESGNAIKIIPSDDVKALTSALQKIVDSPNLLLNMKYAAEKMASTVWNWEHYEKDLISVIRSQFPE